ncbi:MAG: hypothetical protein ACOCQR_01060 [bacterium]
MATDKQVQKAHKAVREAGFTGLMFWGIDSKGNCQYEGFDRFKNEVIVRVNINDNYKIKYRQFRSTVWQNCS